ncbi:Sir2 family NAD-dependent protein deacetylase [Clostridium ganghwense]|uniref:Deacetylase sirtuin-type domain-containing protein n=1 Tax=Clostridium ganghwense TaxID=312089 RepID=A0ABT4CJN9_9CLOT|nr:Sir2 family NAD-dependent protein deacetylase [Clostridium ganghwense]MCY6369261.1 hypothetical protein [Clostridium ganghwense]
MNILEYFKTNNIKKVFKNLEKADCVLIGAGSGLSAAAGIDYTDTKSFAKDFPQLTKKGFSCHYELMGYTNWSKEEQWAYLATNVNHVRFQLPPSPIYKKLFDLVKNKDYFVITSNVDGMFYKSGFDENRIFTPQGDYARYQCCTPCTNETWPIKPVIDKIVQNIDYNTLKVTNPELIPRCPNCGGHVYLNVRGGSWFVEERYMKKGEEYLRWIQESFNKKLFVMEFGVGFNTPSVIRWPFETIVKKHPNVKFLRVNKDYPQVPPEIKYESISIKDNAKNVIVNMEEYL